MVKAKISRKAAKTQWEPRMDTKGTANGHEENTNEPRMNQPSREAMAGKLQIYADRGRLVERCLACEADSGRHQRP